MEKESEKEEKGKITLPVLILNYFNRPSLRHLAEKRDEASVGAVVGALFESRAILRRHDPRREITATASQERTLFSCFSFLNFHLA